MTAEPDIDRAQWEQLLRFYAESGLDFALEPDASDRFAATAAQATKPAEPIPSGAQGSGSELPTATPAAPPPPLSPVTVPDDQALAVAEQAAAGASNLDELQAAVEAFEGCNLKRSARHTVFEGGRRGADLMFVGAAPSRDDDKNGQALSGIDGILFGKMLAAIGLDRASDVYCGFCVPWAVPGGERPTPLHLKICTPLLHRQIALARPRIVLALGNVAAQHLTGSRQTIMQLHGRWTMADFGAGPVHLTALFDPALLREQPRFKRMAWLDLLALKDRLAAQG